MSKLFSRTTVSGSSLTGANLKTTMTALWDALRSVGITDSNRTTVTATSSLVTTQCGYLPVDCTSGSVTLTLPASGSSSDEAEFRIRRIDSASGNTLTVQRAGSDTVEGSASFTIGVGQQFDVKLPAGSTDWKIVARGGSTALAARSAIGAATPTTVQVFTANGTYTKPAGLLYAIVEVQAAGGGGSGAAAGDRGNGGGGGGYARKLLLASAIGSTETVTVPSTGGTAGAAGANAGSAGGNASFGSSVTANGGSGGVLGGGSIGVGAPGGAASGGDINIPGGYGSNEGSAAVGGKGGDSQLGFGGGEVVTSGGVAGRGYGGGGSGGNGNGATARAGGAGAPGIVIVTEFY